jgi:hypothetical protein
MNQPPVRRAEPINIEPAMYTAADRHAVQAVAAREFPQEASVVAPAPPTRSPRMADPGAALLAEAISAHLGTSGSRFSDPTRISLGRLRNQSHSTAAEFAAFRERLASLLNEASRDRGTLFIASDDAPAHYQLLGTVYLITADGFDQWELYLSMTAADRPWAIWQSGSPIRVLRQARPGQPQVFFNSPPAP